MTKWNYLLFPGIGKTAPTKVGWAVTIIATSLAAAPLGMSIECRGRVEFNGLLWFSLVVLPFIVLTSIPFVYGITFFAWLVPTQNRSARLRLSILAVNFAMWACISFCVCNTLSSLG